MQENLKEEFPVFDLFGATRYIQALHCVCTASVHFSGFYQNSSVIPAGSSYNENRDRGA